MLLTTIGQLYMQARKPLGVLIPKLSQVIAYEVLIDLGILSVTVNNMQSPSFFRRRGKRRRTKVEKVNCDPSLAKLGAGDDLLFGVHGECCVMGSCTASSLRQQEGFYTQAGHSYLVMSNDPGL